MRTISRIAVVALLASVAHAEDGFYRGDQVVAYAGAFDVSQQDDQAVLGGLEYRWADQFNGLRPVVGVMGTTDEAAYVYGGAYWDLPLNTAPFVITPGFQAGAYTHGDGKDLGYGLEFRSTIEVAYQFDEGQRLGLGFSHLSNASLGNDNPGTETLQVVYSHPM
jgi:lipid A 3-O-deacylase